MRIAVSVAVMVAATLLWAGVGTMAQERFGWVTRLQVLPMAMTLSMTMTAFWLVVSWLFGRIYCSSVCPLGTWLDVVGHVGRRSRRGTRRDYHYSPPLNRWRYPVLALTVVCFVGEIAIIPALIEPYSIYSQAVIHLVRPLWTLAVKGAAALGADPGGHAQIVALGAFSTALSAATLLAVSIPAWFYGRTYCNTVCPVGTVLGLCSRRSVWHFDIDTDLCTNCRLCEHVCKASCIDLTDHVVDGSRCVNCFDCVAVCPDDAITYSPRRKQLSIPMMQRLGSSGAGAAALDSPQGTPAAETSTSGKSDLK